MPCDIKIQFDKKSDPFIVKLVESAENISLKDIANFIANLSKDKRKNLADLLLSAKFQNIQETDLEKHIFISNTTISDLKSKFPEIGLMFKDLEISLDDKFTIISSNNFKIHGQTYFGRLLDSNGNEIFVINGKYGAEHFFKYLHTRNKLKTLDQETFNTPELNKLVNKFKSKSGLDLILDFLNNRSKYKPYKEGTEIISPADIIYNFVGKVVNYYNTEVSDFSLSMDSDEFTIPKLLEILKMYNPNLDIETVEKLVLENQDEFKKIIYQELLKDPKWSKARIESITGGEIKKIEAKTGFLTIVELKKVWTDIRKKDKTLPTYDKATSLLLLDNLKKEFDENGWTDKYGDHYKINIEENNGKIKAIYEIPEKTKRTNFSVKFNFPYEIYLSDVYDYSYNTKSLFKLVEKYKGGYIYEYFKDGIKHYVVTRHIISPNTIVWNYSTVEQAKNKIDRMNKSEKIIDNGLYSIRYKNSVPRTAVLELQNIKEGQIITINDVKLKNIRDIKTIPEYFKKLMLGTVDNLHSMLYDINSNIILIDSPLKASAFILTLYEITKDQNYEEITEELVQTAINIVTESETINYMVEQVLGNNYVVLKRLINDGNELDISGKFSEEKPANINILNQMNSAVEYFKNTLGILIESMSKGELELFSLDNNLGLENKLNTIKAFVYNGTIYINASNSNLSDLFHEISHIFMGILRVKYPKAYQELIQKYKLHKRFIKNYEKVKRNYENFAMLDKLEEVVANLIAEDLFLNKSLATVFNGNEFIQEFDLIFKTLENALNDTSDSGLNFSTFIKNTLLEEKDLINKSRKMTQLVADLRSKRKIIEFDCK